jgi:hypothetical protein
MTSEESERRDKAREWMKVALGEACNVEAEPAIPAESTKYEERTRSAVEQPQSSYKGV